MVLATLLFLVNLFGCTGIDSADPRYEMWNDELADAPADELIYSRTKAEGGSNGDFDYCDDASALCDAGEGDCDNDTQCSGLLVCGQNNGGNYGFANNLDLCWPTHCENGILDGDEVSIDNGGSCSSLVCPPAGANNGDGGGYCTEICPCPTGFGDCDSDAHCAAGTVCMNNNGELWGMPTNYDVCVPSHCENGTLDGDETSVDQGGSCGVIDNCLQVLFFADGDGDTYGDVDTVTGGCAGDPLPGFVEDNSDDCDDTNGAIFPGATEICDGEDNDCDGAIDEGVGSQETYYADADFDTYGDVGNSIEGCGAPPGYVSDDQDCNDGNSSINPGVAEVCANGVDDNCDGSANGCTLSGNVDVYSQGHAFLTGATDDGAGYSISSGDVDGDGVGDLAVGAPVIPWRLSPVQPGSVYLIYGPVPSGNASLSSVADATFVGEADFDHAGLGLAINGDLDQDGNDDLAFGAPDHAQDTTGGRAYAFYGKSSNYTGTINMSTADFIINGNAPEQWLGASLDMGGDVSGFVSYPDLMVGAPGDMNDGAGGGSGGAYALRGDPNPDSGSFTAQSNFNARIAGTDADSGFGSSVIGVGDVGGGNRGDFAVGAPGRYWWPSKGDSYAGDVYVFFGQISGTMSTADADVVISGIDTDDWLGVNIAGAADLDNDGINELICGASGDSSIATQAGKALVFRGPLASGSMNISDADITILGDTAYTYVGEGISTGDFNGDGNVDLAVSSWADGGYLWYGGLVDGTYGMASADIIVNANSGPGMQNFGSPTKFVGDITGDGLDDLVVSDVGYSSSAGAIYILAGNNGL
jgi:hypothetical protein